MSELILVILPCTQPMGCRVESFEPLPDAFYWLEFSTILNGFSGYTNLHRQIMGNVTGQKQMIKDNNWGLSHVTDKGGIPVEATTLDNAIKEDVLLLKIDVEGYEDNVFKGAKEFLSRYNVDNIICETKKNGDVQAKLDFINELKTSGYTIYSYEEKYKDIEIEYAMTVGWEADFGAKIQLINDVTEASWIPWEDLWFVKSRH